MEKRKLRGLFEKGKKGERGERGARHTTAQGKRKNALSIRGRNGRKPSRIKGTEKRRGGGVRKKALGDEEKRSRVEGGGEKYRPPSQTGGTLGGNGRV